MLIMYSKYRLTYLAKASIDKAFCIITTAGPYRVISFHYLNNITGKQSGTSETLGNSEENYGWPGLAPAWSFDMPRESFHFTFNHQRKIKISKIVSINELRCFRYKNTNLYIIISYWFAVLLRWSGNKFAFYITDWNRVLYESFQKNGGVNLKFLMQCVHWTGIFKSLSSVVKQFLRQPLWGIVLKGGSEDGRRVSSSSAQEFGVGGRYSAG